MRNIPSKLNHNAHAYLLILTYLMDRSQKYHGRPQNFFQGRANYGSGDKSPPAGSRDGVSVGVWELCPQKPTTGCENNA